MCSLLESYWVSCFLSISAHLFVCLSVRQFEVQFDVMSVDCNFFIRLVVVMCFCSFLSGIWSRPDGSPGMVQKVSTIRKCQRSDTGLGFVLLGFQANLQTTPTGAAKTLQSTRRSLIFHTSIA